MFLKANIFSLIYLLFIFRYVKADVKIHLLVRLVKYMAVGFIIQYLLFLLNLSVSSAPQTFPYQFSTYPVTVDHLYSKKLDIKYGVPLFFNYETFHDLKLSFLLGIGINKDQIDNLILDFINLYLISMYILNYRNPILVKSMKKVFWCFPDNFSEVQDWKRLDPIV